MSKNIVFEGWLTKSPPTKRVWRAKWRRRWFALRQSGELPGQYFLDYYADRNCRRLKGTINLDLCEQVDAGLRMERSNGSLDNRFCGSVFTVRTQSRTYHLEAENEEDMAKWVEAICRVCGLRSTDDSTEVMATYQNSPSNAEQLEFTDGGVYIPISECITGLRAQDMQTAFTFDPKNIHTSNRFGSMSSRSQTSESRLTNTDTWDAESAISVDDCTSLNSTSQTNFGNWSVTKSFTKLAVAPKRNGAVGLAAAAVAEEAPQPHMVTGPPVPPRPPKTFQGPKLQEPNESNSDALAPHPSPRLRVPRRLSHGNSPTSPGRPLAPQPQPYPRYTDDEDEAAAHPSMQYCNISLLPPAVDRACKPRYRVHSHSIGHINTLHTRSTSFQREGKDVLQYLDLDLPASKPPIKQADGTTVFVHGKSYSTSDSHSAYKTVDFLKTEAFNITRQDLEEARNAEY